MTDYGFLALVILVVFVFVGFVYSATTLNSSAYAIATVASKGMTEGTDVEPRLFNRITWAIFLGAVALGLMYQDEVVQRAAAGAGAVAPGGSSLLTAVKVSSLIVAVPLMVCVSIAVASFFKWIGEDRPHLQVETRPGDGG
jgi:BCCT family betaine/carnitine transporter